MLTYSSMLILGKTSIEIGATTSKDFCDFSIITLIKNPSCFSNQDGTIIINPTDGKPPYSWVLKGIVDERKGSGLNIPNVAKGSYELIVTDSNDCLTTTTVKVEDPPIQEEMDELLKLYHATDGLNWSDNTGWKAGSEGTDCDPCSWYGVYCIGKSVALVELENNNLNGTIPNLNLPNMLALVLDQNALKGPIPPF